MTTTAAQRTGQSANDTSTVDKRRRIVDATIRRYQARQDALIEVLHTAQNTYALGVN